MKNEIDVPEQHEQLPLFYWLPKLHKKLTVPGPLLLPINALQNSFHHYLLLALKPYLLIIINIVMVFISTLEVIVFGLLITLLKYWTGYIKLIRQLIRPQELDDLIVMILS